MSKCCGLWGRLFGHHYVARYDNAETYAPESAKLLDIALSRINTSRSVILPDEVNAIREIADGFRQLSNTEKFYVQDVCTRCGEAMERPADPIERLDVEELLEELVARVKASGPFERAQLRETVKELVSLIPKRTLEEQKADEAEAETQTEDASGINRVVCVKCFHHYTDEDDACPKCGTKHVSDRTL